MNHIRFLPLIIFALALPARPQDLPPAPGRLVQSLTAVPGYFTEPSIAVNARNPMQVVAAFQDNVHVAYSENGGRDWQLAQGVEPPNYRVSGDVSITYDHQGHAVLCYMAFDKLGTFNYWGHNSSRNGLFVRQLRLITPCNYAMTWHNYKV